jgi:hypothetical protein
MIRPLQQPDEVQLRLCSCRGWLLRYSSHVGTDSLTVSDANFVVRLAIHWPCAEPAVYANADETRHVWEAQGALLLDARVALDRLQP